MTRAALALAVAIGLTLPAFAQGTAPAADARTESEIRQTCRTTIDQGLQGPERQKAIMDCVVKERPDSAVEAQCRMEGRNQGLKPPDLGRYVMTCSKAKNAQ